MSEDATRSTHLTRKLWVALLTPVALLILVGSVLGVQILRMTTDAKWVDHTDEVLAKINDLQKQIIDQETGVRGYLVVGEALFLEPTEKARPLDALSDLKRLVADNPDELQRVDEIGQRYERWRASSLDTIHDEGALEHLRQPSMMRDRKARMDDIRTSISAMLSAETALRHARAELASRSLFVTEVAFFSVFTIAALALAFLSRRQLGEVATTFGEALERERKSRLLVERQDWVRSGQMILAEAAQGDPSVSVLTERVLSSLAKYTKADIGALFTLEGSRWVRSAAYAVDSRSGSESSFALGEGLVGQAANQKEPIHVKGVPDSFFKVQSGTGAAMPADLVLVSTAVDDSPFGVIELGFLGSANDDVVALLGHVRESIAIAIRSSEHKRMLRDLLEEAQRQAEELQAQQEELRVTNEELEEQSNALRVAHQELEQQKEELTVSNARLEEQAEELMRTHRAVSEKATEVARANRYKSEFLANMSHELRTPLNSTLILARLLADNKHENLTPEQIKFAETIYSAGNDLLTLINDILDLSKIEAGKADIHVTTVKVSRLIEKMKLLFEPVARERGLEFKVDLRPDAPATLETDEQRLEQIVKNLLSNALKFTEKGSVILLISSHEASARFSVLDTGIGIKQDQLGVIFEAFQQVDGTIARRYGGTGLGLSISRDLARLLGGNLTVESVEHQGSTFTLSLPLVLQPGEESHESTRAQLTSVVPAPVPMPLLPGPRTTRLLPVGDVPQATFEDDRAKLDQQGRVVLIIEDDVAFAKILADLAHEARFQCVVSHGMEDGLELATKIVPSAILLDVNLPDQSGLSGLERLKRNSKTRHIPVHVASVSDYAQAAMSMGAIGYLMKPAPREKLSQAFARIEKHLARGVRRLLIVEDDSVQRDGLRHLLGSQDVETVAVATVEEALTALSASSFDCVVTDLQLVGASGYDLLEKMAEDPAFASPPVIVYTGRSLSAAEEQRLRRYSHSVIVKGARSPERLLDEVTLFLHQVESELPPERQRMLKQARDREALFDGRRILIVEDDVRNVFALTSVLEPKGVKLSIARNGREALEVLEASPDIELVLMDIMMPEMDGLEATRRIRKQDKWARLPVIALTAKAMSDDQERCREAGANDFIAKPLNVDLLLSLLRVWMPK